MRWYEILLIFVGGLLGLMVTVSLGVFIWRFATSSSSLVSRATPLVDVLTIVLAVAGVVIAAVGYLTYRLASERIERRAVAEVRAETLKNKARLLTYIGYVYWVDFECTKDARYIEQAIDLTKGAHDVCARELDERERENELLIGAIRNNLAYYLAKRGRPEDRSLSRGYAEYIHSRSQNFPEQREDWEDTYRFVLQVYP